MDFGDAIRKCMIEKYRPMIEGRAPRSEFWWFVLFQFLVSAAVAVFMSIGIALVAAPLSTGAAPSASAIIGAMLPLGIVFLAMPLLYYLIPPMVAVTIRRLHDRDMSGWWYLGFSFMMLVPLVNVIVAIAMLVLMLLPGTAGPNRFGPDPLATEGTGVFE